MTTKTVVYRGHRHEVIGTVRTLKGTSPLYRLRSRFERTSSFYAAQADCRPVK